MKDINFYSNPSPYTGGTSNINPTGQVFGYSLTSAPYTGGSSGTNAVGENFKNNKQSINPYVGGESNINPTGQSLGNSKLPTKSKNKLLTANTLNTIGQVADIVVPLTDNIVNYFMTKNTPKIPKPILDKPTIVEDRINVDNQLAAIENNKREAFRAIDEKVSDVAVANAMKREISKNATNSMLEVLNKKEEIERELRDKNASSIAQTNNSNNRLLDAYNMNVAARKFGMKEDYSENLADLTKDYYNYRNRSDLKDAQDIEIQAITKMFNIPVSTHVFGDIPEILNSLTEEQLAIYYKLRKGQPELQALAREIAKKKKYDLTKFE